MQNRKLSSRWHEAVCLVCFLLAENAFSAVVIVDAERFIEADASAIDGDGQSVSDDPPAIQVFGTDPLFDENTSASASVDVATASATSIQSSTFTSTGIQANGSYSAEANFLGSIGGDGAAGAIARNSLLVEFTANGGGFEQQYRLTGNLTNFDASGSTAQLSFGGSGGGESVTATNESVDFVFSGVLPALGVYTLNLNLIGVTDAATPPFGDLSQISSGSFDFALEIIPVPVPAAAWLFGSALAGLGWLRRKQTV